MQRGFADLLPRMSLPAYLAAVLTLAEEHLIQRDVAMHTGDESVAYDREEQIVGLLCTALTRAVDEYRVPPGIEIAGHTEFLRGGQRPPSDHDNLATFRQQELDLLHLVGLSRGLATKHLDAAFDAVHQSSGVIESVADLAAALEQAATAACSTQQLLRRRREGVADRRRARKRTYRCVLATGGVLIVVANTAALTILGPLGAASLALGGGAAGAAANLIED